MATFNIASVIDPAAFFGSRGSSQVEATVLGVTTPQSLLRRVDQVNP